MSRPTPAVVRVVSILNLLAANPGQSFSLSDILRALDMNRATLHSILVALVEVGYLYRGNDKTYTLGPALMRIAHSAKDNVSPLQIALPEMRVLADSYGAICSACFKVKEEAVVRERAVSAAHVSWQGAPTQRFTLEPPVGSAFMAWASETEIANWCKKLGAKNTRTEVMMESLEFPRREGYSFCLRKHRPTEPFDFEHSHLRVKDTDFLIKELVPDNQYDLAFVAAPVFDDRGQVAFILAMSGLGQFSGSAIGKIGRELRGSCDRITAAINGKFPANSR